KITTLIYVAKLLLFYVLGGVLLATLTSGLNPLHPAAWWDDVVVYQKAVLWTVLLECLGVAGSWGAPGRPFQPVARGVPLSGRARARSGSRRGPRRCRSPAATRGRRATSRSTRRCSPAWSSRWRCRRSPPPR